MKNKGKGHHHHPRVKMDKSDEDGLLNAITFCTKDRDEPSPYGWPTKNIFGFPRKGKKKKLFKGQWFLMSVSLMMILVDLCCLFHDISSVEDNLIGPTALEHFKFYAAALATHFMGAAAAYDGHLFMAVIPMISCQVMMHVMFTRTPMEGPSDPFFKEQWIADNVPVHRLPPGWKPPKTNPYFVTMDDLKGGEESGQEVVFASMGIPPGPKTELITPDMTLQLLARSKRFKGKPIPGWIMKNLKMAAENQARKEEAFVQQNKNKSDQVESFPPPQKSYDLHDAWFESAVPKRSTIRSMTMSLKADITFDMRTIPGSNDSSQMSVYAYKE